MYGASEWEGIPDSGRLCGTIRANVESGDLVAQKYSECSDPLGEGAVVDWRRAGGALWEPVP